MYMTPDFAIIAASLCATVFTFLFGLEKFSGQVERLAGNRFRELIQKATNYPPKAVLVGIIITSILSSSTAVSVLLVSLARAGVIPLYNSLGVIIGANIGTTLTTQLVAFKILTIAPYILIAGFIVMHIKSSAQRYGKAIFYFGLVFSSLFIMSYITSQFSENAYIINLVTHTSNLFVAIAVGIFLSTVLQSSLAAAAVVVILASQGLLDFEQSLGIILGTNIGTTTTALLASTVSNKSGRQVALGHLLFNVVGVILFLPLINPTVTFFTQINVTLAQQVTLSHLFFNLYTALIFIIGFNLFHKAVLFLTQSRTPQK